VLIRELEEKSMDVSGRWLAAALAIVLCLIGCHCNGRSDDPDHDGLGPTAEHDVAPGWAPDNTKIAFERYGNPLKDIQGGVFLLNLADSSLTPLLSQSNTLGQPDFSPDGRWIACASEYIYMVLSNGDSLQQLTQGVDDNYFPDWSPDGKKIAYGVSAGPERGIYILDVETKETRLIYRYARFPVWFPDGARLLTRSSNFDSGPELAIIDTSGNLLKRLTDEDVAERYGNDISPDGSLICFSQQFERELPQLWIMNSDGTGLAKITTNGATWPSFSTDGEWIAFTYIGEANGCLWLTRPDGSDMHQITFWGEDY
jgi:Tol biopolymer transport system component